VPVGGVLFRRHFREPLGVLGLADAPEESTAFRRFVSASLRVITLAISPSMVRRECGPRPGIVASEELVPKSPTRNRSPFLKCTVTRPGGSNGKA
jgi:hypothetical protein